MCLGSKWRLYGREPTGRLDPPIVPRTPLGRSSLQSGPAHLWEGALGGRFLMLGFSLPRMLSST